jgi:hypothetical protein
MQSRSFCLPKERKIPQHIGVSRYMTRFFGLMKISTAFLFRGIVSGVGSDARGADNSADHAVEEEEDCSWGVNLFCGISSREALCDDDKSVVLASAVGRVFLI